MDLPRRQRLPPLTTRHLALVGALWAAVLLALVVGANALSACVPCDDPGYRVDILTGPLPVPAGGQLELTVGVIGGGLNEAPRCDGYWLVNGRQGGSLLDGTVSGCGVYQAPAQLASPRAVTVTWSEFEPGACTVCCPAANRQIDLTP